MLPCLEVTEESKTNSTLFKIVINLNSNNIYSCNIEKNEYVQPCVNRHVRGHKETYSKTKILLCFVCHKSTNVNFNN